MSAASILDDDKINYYQFIPIIASSYEYLMGEENVKQKMEIIRTAALGFDIRYYYYYYYFLVFFILPYYYLLAISSLLLLLFCIFPADDNVYLEYYSGRGFHINHSCLHVLRKTHKLVQ
jgi:hypothetical protein